MTSGERDNPKGKEMPYCMSCNRRLACRTTVDSRGRKQHRCDECYSRKKLFDERKRG